MNLLENKERKIKVHAVIPLYQILSAVLLVENMLKVKSKSK